MQVREATHTNTHVELGLDHVMQRIAVQRPYFAFAALHPSPSPPWEIYGEFVPEQLLGAEVGPIATAEAGRHLAILGSCAAALAHQERVYYLAAKAVWRRGGDVTYSEPASTLTARARITERTRHGVTAQAELLAEDNIIGSLEVRYHALPEASFAWLYARNAVAESQDIVPSPYGRPLPLVFDRLRAGCITAELQHAGRDHSAGHFPGYPMWPVAILMVGIGQTVTHLLETTLGCPVRFRVERADIEAFELVPLSASLTFESALENLRPPHCELRCDISAAGRRIAQFAALLWLEKVG